jgi:hypothetical protein
MFWPLPAFDGLSGMRQRGLCPLSQQRQNDSLIIVQSPAAHGDLPEQAAVHV